MAQENSVSFKVFLNRGETDAKPEVRRFGVDRDVVSNFTYLSEKLQNIFPSLRNKVFEVFWKDAEGDDILISTDDELMIALTETTGDVHKLYVTIKGEEKKKVESSKQEGRRHRGVVCDECNANVTGYRYKCLQCSNYDLCATCESRGFHSDHFVIRLPFPVVWRPNLGKRFVYHLGNAVERFNSSNPCSVDDCSERTCAEEECSGSAATANARSHGRSHGHWHAHSHSRGHSRWQRGERGERPPSFLDALSTFVSNLLIDPVSECPVARKGTQSGEAKDRAGATTAGGTKDTTVSGTDAEGSADQKEKMQYLQNLGQAVADILDPLGIDVDVIVENINGERKKPEDSKSNGEEKSKKNVSFVDEVANKEKEEEKTKEVKTEEATKSTAGQERESPEKDGWAWVNKNEAQVQESQSANGGSGEAASAKAEAGVGKGDAANGVVYTSSVAGGAVPKTRGEAGGGYPAAYASPFPPPGGFPVPLAQWHPVQPPPPSAATAFPLGFPGFPSPAVPVAVPVPQPAQSQPLLQPPQRPPQATSATLHHDPKINAVVQSMMSMGFSNEGGWLTQLVEMKNGDMDKVLDLLQPVTKK